MHGVTMKNAENLKGDISQCVSVYCDCV